MGPWPRPAGPIAAPAAAAVPTARTAPGIPAAKLQAPPRSAVPSPPATSAWRRKTVTSRATMPSTPKSAGTAQPDGVDHHVLLVGALHHVLEAAVVRTLIHRLVHAVGEHEDHAAALFVEERGNADVDRVPKRGWSFRLQILAKDGEQLFVVAREGARV